MGTINYWKIFIQGITYERLFKNNSRSQTSKRLATKEIFEKDLNNQVANYLKGRISMDPAVLSTSLDKAVSIRFIKYRECTVVPKERI